MKFGKAEKVHVPEGCEILLSHNTKGRYSWRIVIKGASEADALAKIDALEKDMIVRYGPSVSNSEA